MSLCPHWWRRMTSDKDYANSWSPHWGEYHGVEEEICRVCRTTREVRGWQAWRYELDDAEKRVQYLRSTEPQQSAAEQRSEEKK